jgi:GntR family transcriptional regulator, transcriptional repressor for pyruvate dehydrogenase complex
MSDTSLFAPVRGQRMSGEIVGQMLALIRNGRLQEGDRLPAERELATQMGVSRVTVRDALRVLEVMGLVTIRVGSAGGAFIRRPSADVIGENVFNLLTMGLFEPQQIAEARLVLELGILDLAVERVTDEDLEALTDICRRSREAFEAGDYDRELAVAFHTRLARATKNEAIAMLSESFAGPLSMAAVRATQVRKDANRRTIEEHEQIVRALRDRNPERASRVMITHLLRGRRADKGAQRLIRRHRGQG